jgi:hypothetical protein
MRLVSCGDWQRGPVVGINETRWHCSSQGKLSEVEAQHRTLAAQNCEIVECFLESEMKRGQMDVTEKKWLLKILAPCVYRTSSRLFRGLEDKRSLTFRHVIEAVQLLVVSAYLQYLQSETLFFSSLPI